MVRAKREMASMDPKMCDVALRAYGAHQHPLSEETLARKVGAPSGQKHRVLKKTRMNRVFHDYLWSVRRPDGVVRKVMFPEKM